MTVVKLELFPVCYAFWCLLSSSQLQHIKPQLSFYISVCLWINKQTRYNIISDFEVTFPIAPSAGNSFHLNPVNINIYWMVWHTIWYRYPLCLAWLLSRWGSTFSCGELNVTFFVFSPHQKPKRARHPVHQLAVMPASIQTKCPRTLWTSWKTSIRPAGRFTSSAELLLWACPTRRSVECGMMIILKNNKSCVQCLHPFAPYDLLTLCVSRTSVLTNCRSACRISIRTCPTAWWVILKVRSQQLLIWNQQYSSRVSRTHSYVLNKSDIETLEALKCDTALTNIWGLKYLCSAGSSESVEQVMDQVEKYIMTRLYKSVFCPETTDDEKKDLATQNRIRWVSLDSKLAVM